jgi:predicted RNase H-like nuclease (RuvC/YqgF family)
MNAKRVSFSDINEILIIPCVEGTKKLMTPWKKDLTVYSDEDLKEQIRKRKENAIRDAKKQFTDLERKYKELHQCIQELDEELDEEDDHYYEYEIYHTMMEENFFEQSVLTRKLIALFEKK